MGMDNQSVPWEWSAAAAVEPHPLLAQTEEPLRAVEVRNVGIRSAGHVGVRAVEVGRALQRHAGGPGNLQIISVWLRRDETSRHNFARVQDRGGIIARR